MKVKLSDAFDLQMGKTPSRNEPAYWGGTRKWVSIADISGAEKYIRTTKERITDRGVQESGIKPVPKGTVIMSFKLSIGRAAITAEDMFTNEAIMAFLDKRMLEVDASYLYYLLSGTDWTAGTNRAVMGLTLNKAVLSEKEIDIPALDAQLSAVRTLDKVSGLIALRKRQLTKLDELVMTQFVERFGHPATNSLGWERVKLSDCLLKIDSGRSLNCESFPRKGNLPAVLKLSAITYGEYNPKENKQLPSQNAFIPDLEVHDGDLLFSRKNTYEYVGMSVFVRKTPENLMLPDLIFRLVLSDKCRPIYLNRLVNHTLYRPVIQKLASGSTGSMPNISKGRLLNLEIPLPPLELQKSFEALVDRIDKAKLEIQQGLDKLETLKAALMGQYFS